MEAVTRRRFNAPHALEGHTIEFRQSVHLLRLAVKAAFSDPQFQNTIFRQGELRAASATLDRAWNELEAKIVNASPVTDSDEVAAVEEAVRLVDFVVTDGFGARFDEMFPAESDAIHCAASVVWDTWRSLDRSITSPVE